MLIPLDRTRKMREKFECVRGLSFQDENGAWQYGHVRVDFLSWCNR